MSAHTPSFADSLRVDQGFILSSVDPRSTPAFTGDKAAGQAALADGVAELDDLQERLYAASRVHDDAGSVLLVLQAMDSAGKGGIIRHVVGSVDPQGVDLVAFKQPTPAELRHDFLWRIAKRTPGNGAIGVFDRSHYEDVLIGRVRELATPAEIDRRYGAINDFEAELSASGTRIVKVMLHISYAEQGERLLARLDNHDKQWKFNPGDIAERSKWPHYMDAYQTVFERTSTEVAPWYVVPADRKWYARLAVQQLLTETLRSMNPQWPAPDYDVKQERKRLTATF